MDILLQGTLPPMGFEKLTVGSAVKSLTSTVYKKQIGSGSSAEPNKYDRVTAKLATITTETDAIRVRFDGTDPDSTTGHLYPAGSTIELQSSSQIANFRAIRTGGDAVIQVTYWGA